MAKFISNRTTKIIQTLIRTVLVGTKGVDVRINQEGLHSLVLETQDEVMA
jgi:hypothetical protein